MNEENYGISLGQWNAVFAVPVCVVDQHMKLAGAAQLKVLLYLLRHAGEPVTLDGLAFAVGQKTEDTLDALSYWVNCGVLSRVQTPDGSFVPASAASAETTHTPEHTEETEQTNHPEDKPAAVSKPPVAEIKNALGMAPPRVRDKVRYPFDECMRFVAQDEQLRNMLLAVENVMGKQITHTEASCFVTLVKWYGLPCTIIPMLIQYCKSIGKTSIAYMESTGIGWAAEEIDTFEKAESKIAAQTARRKAWQAVRTALEIPERKATDAEMKYCDLWINGQHIDIELVRHAYDKCVNKNGKPSFAYMNGIIKRYYEQGITDVTSALRLDEQNRAAMEQKRAACDAAGVSRAASADRGNADGGRYGETYATEDIEAILDAEWMSESVGSDSDYNYDD